MGEEGGGTLEGVGTPRSGSRRRNVTESHDPRGILWVPLNGPGWGVSKTELVGPTLDP